jgi:hypothetical protein
MRRGGTFTNLSFIIAVLTFFSFLTIMEVSYATSSGTLLKNAPTTFSAPSCSTGLIIIDGLLGCAWSYLQVFLGLMAVSSEFLVFNSIVIFVLIAGVGWAVVSLLRGGGG